MFTREHILLKESPDIIRLLLIILEVLIGYINTKNSQELYFNYELINGNVHGYENFKAMGIREANVTKQFILI